MSKQNTNNRTVFVDASFNYKVATNQKGEVRVPSTALAMLGAKSGDKVSLSLSKDKKSIMITPEGTAGAVTANVDSRNVVRFRPAVLGVKNSSFNMQAYSSPSVQKITLTTTR